MPADSDDSGRVDGEGEPDGRFRCPGCDEDVDVAAAALGQLVRCPYCRIDFFADDRVRAEVVDDRPAEPERDREAELDSNRVGQVLALRRGAIKARSMWVIAAFLGGSTALDFAAKAGLYLSVFHRWGGRPTAFAVVAATAVAFVAYSLRRAAGFARELAATTLPEPTTPPDFAPLGNATERWRLLDQVR